MSSETAGTTRTLKSLSVSQEFWIIVGTVILLTTGVSWLGKVVPMVGQWGSLIIALVFIYVPVEMLERRGVSLKQMGIWRGNWKKGIRQFATVSLLVFPLYAVLFHYFQTDFVDKSPQFEIRKLQDWPLEFAPSSTNQRVPKGFRVTLKGDRIFFKWKFDEGSRLKIKLEGNHPLHRLGTLTTRTTDRHTWTVNAENKGSIALQTKSTVLSISLQIDGKAASPEQILDAYDQPIGSGPIELHRNGWWFIHFLMGQLLLVALPEEVFYRGYLQSRLEQKFPRKHRVFGAMISWPALLWTSTIFALGHILTIPNPARLAVFFPSLLFGWMRSASGSVLSAVLFHAACNIFAQIAFKFYI